MPLFSIIPASIGVLMLWCFLTVFNALRFTQCPSWVLLQQPPGNTVALLGAPLNRLYVETENKSVYCLRQGKWANCAHLQDDSEPDMAPAWLMNNFSAAFEGGNVLQVIRANGFFDMNYYSLHKDGRVYSCSTNINAELENIISSGAFTWLLIPLAGMVWSIATFVGLFIKHGQPTLWDFWGRGERIK